MKPFFFMSARGVLILGLALGECGIGIAQAPDDPKAERLNQLHREGTQLSAKGDSAGALAKFEEGLTLAEELENKRTMAALMMRISNIISRRGDYRKALEYYQ